MLRHHLLDNGLDEVDIAVATCVPRPINAIGEDANKLGGVANGFHAHVIILELVELHPVGILIVSVTENEQRTVLA